MSRDTETVELPIGLRMSLLLSRSAGSTVDDVLRSRSEERSQTPGDTPSHSTLRDPCFVYSSAGPRLGLTFSLRRFVTWRMGGRSGKGRVAALQG